MIQNRTFHIMALIVAMTIGAAMGAQAKSVETAYAIEHFEGSQWRVEKFGDGPTARGFTFSFADGGIYVRLPCEPFIATRQPDGTMLIESVDTPIMCFAFPQREYMISLFFSDLETLVPLDENTLRLGDSHGDYIIATRIENHN